MKAEQKELYYYTKNNFISDLNKISKNSISPIIATKRVVKAAMYKYIKDYCTNGENPFSGEDFQEVSNIICDEIINNEL